MNKIKEISSTKKRLVNAIVGQGIIEFISDGISIHDTGYHVLYQNRRSIELLGDNVGKLCYKAFKNENTVCNKCPMSKSFQDGMIHSSVLRRETRLGQQTLKITSSPVKNSSGSIVGGIEIIKDVSVRSVVKKHASQSPGPESDWQDIFDSINDAITIHDRDFNIIQFNVAAEKMLGCSKDEIMKSKCYKLYHGSVCPPTSCPSCQSMKIGTPSVTEMFEPKLNKYLEIKAFPRFNKQQEVVGVVHIIRDISERKKLEREREDLIFDLTEALFKVKTLSGLLPICASCKKIRNDNGYWQQVDDYIREHSNADFTHGICPECSEKMFPDNSKSKS